MTVARMGLRERKKRRTRDTISTVAIGLFLERGFDHVSVAEIAEVAEVSKPTLFNYFPTKEDLVLHWIADHAGEAARIVRGAGSGQRPLAALSEHFLDGLARRDPITGLCDAPQTLAIHRMVFDTPSLAARLSQHTASDEAALTQALLEAMGPPAGADQPAGECAEDREITARLVAAQVIAVWRVLARDNWRQLAAGQTARQRYPAAVRSAGMAFALLERGLLAVDC